MSVVHTMIQSDGRATIFLEGEIDLATVPALREVLATCHANKVRDIEVDLAAVGFCDVSGLHVFLAASRRAEEEGLRLRHPAPVVRRLMELTGTGFLLTGGRPGAQPSSGAA